MPEERGRIPPHSLEAEEGLLGSCLIDPGQDIFSSCMEVGLRPESFFKPAHRVIFHILSDLFSQNKGMDEVSVLDALSSRPVASIEWLRHQQRLTDPKTPLIQMVGGASAITQLTNRIESIANARYWLDIVRQKWLLRRLIETTSHITEEAYVNQDQLESFINQAESRILSINEDRLGDSAKEFKISVDKAAHLIRSILEGEQEEGVVTGYADIDKMTFGLHPGQMVVLAARPSMGKTSLGMNIVENVALPVRGQPKGTLVFSLEMPAEQLAMRMLCGRAKVSMRRVRDRMLSHEQQRLLAKEAAVLKEAAIWVDDSSGINILEMRAKARRIKRQHGIDLVVVDYLQLINGTDSRVPREQQISEISRGIKAMAKELNVPVLILSQLNRSSEKENRQPRISDLRESGSIEQDADVVLLLAARKDSEDNAPVPQASRERDLIIAKQRNGPTGSVPLTFIPEFTRFENYTAQPEQ
ncbi:MAG TPA: replicative DNA helicase [Oceanipulchritudo sp.]|nr:replicative DNA helicase [Oceanipulchritudo sp.]